MLGNRFGLQFSKQIQSLAQLMKSAGSDLYLDARKANGISQGINSPLVNPWVDLTKNGNNATFQNIAGTTSDGWDLQAVANSNGSVIDYTNLVVNGDFSDGTTGWGAISTTLNVVGGVGKFTATATSGRVFQALTLTAGKRYYVSAKIKASSNLVQLRDTTSGIAIKSHSGSGQTELLSGIITPVSSGARNIAVSDTRTSAWTEIEMDDVQCVALDDNTQIQAIESQLGHQLTTLECDRIFPFVATTGQTKVSARPFLKLDGVDTVGIIPNNPSVDIVGLDEFEIDIVILTPSTIGNTTLYFDGNNGVNLSERKTQVYTISDGTLAVILEGVAIALSTSNFIVGNTIYNIKISRSSGRLICTVNGVIIYNQPNVVNLITKNYKRIGARTNDATGATHASFSNAYIGALSISKNPDFTKLSSAWAKVVKDYI